MCFFFSLIPATIFLVVAYFVFFASARAEGTIRRFGNILAIWVLVIAVFFPICGFYVTVTGRCPMDKMMQQMEMPVKPPID